MPAGAHVAEMGRSGADSFFCHHDITIINEKATAAVKIESM